MKAAKAWAGAATVLVVYAVAELGLDLPQGVVAAVGTVITGVVVYRVRNRAPSREDVRAATLEGGGSHIGGWKGR